MQIKGEVRLQYLYEDGHLEDIGPPVHNDISWVNFRQFFVNTTDTMSIPTKRDSVSIVNTNQAKWRVFYGAADSKQSVLGGWYNQDGYANASQDFPTYETGALVTDPDRFRVTAVIPAPTSSQRTIRCLGLNILGNGSQSTVSNLSGAHLTHVRLNTPCTQPINLAIVVTYDLFLYPNIVASDNRINDQLYTYLKTLLKQTADAVNAVAITYGVYGRSLITTAYNLDNIPSFSPSMTDASSVGYEHEMVDAGGFTPSPSTTFFANAIRNTMSFNATSVQANGCFFKKVIYSGLGIGGSTPTRGGGFAYTDAKSPTDTNPVQNVYPQRNTPPGPTQDLTVNNTATMTGNLVFNTSAWVDPNIQRLIRVNITNTGPVGTATYKLSVMDFIAGFIGNTWQTRTALLPQSFRTDQLFRKNGANTPYETYIASGGTTFRSPDGNKFVLAADCTRTTNGVNVYDVIRGSRHTLDSAIGLNVTAVSDGECTDLYYYICCANTGLWRISLDFTVVENIPSPTGVDKAYQICRKNDANKTIWVMFDGGLCKLSNPNAALGSLTWSVHNPTTGVPTFTALGITDSNWSSVTAMIMDPDNVDDRFLIQTAAVPGGDYSASHRKAYTWWSTSTGTAFNPSTSGHVGNGFSSANWTVDELTKTSDIIRCSNDRWITTRSTHFSASTTNCHFAFGSNNFDSTYFQVTGNGRRPVPAVFNGTPGILMSDALNLNASAFFIKDTVIPTITNGATLTTGSSFIEFYLHEGANSNIANMATTSLQMGGQNAPLLYLPVSNMVFSYEIKARCYGVTPFMLRPTNSKYAIYKDAFWKEYGWTGAAWVLGDPGSKETSAVNDTIDVLDNLGISFNNGATGTSFVNNEFFTFVVGNGLFKDNGVNAYTNNFWVSFDACKNVSMTTTVPQTALGLLTDEPLTFTPNNPNRNYGNMTDGTVTSLLQNKGTVYSVTKTSGIDSQLIADQLIPASTPFDLRFKFYNVTANGEGVTCDIGLATGTTTTYTNSIRFRLNRTTGALQIYNNTTLLATIATPDIEKECRITRDASNNVVAYYDGVEQHSAIVISSRFVVLANAGSGATGGGWYDAKITYTENRRVLRIGDQGLQTGSYSPKFAGLTSTPLALDTQVLIGSGSPLAAILDYSSAGVDLTATGNVKVAPGAGWLIFHDSEPANPITVSTVAHFILNNQ